MKRIALSLIGMLVMSGPLVARAADAPVTGIHYRSLGPAISGGRLAAVVGSDRDPALYYAGAADGGVWKSTDGGGTWKPTFDGQDVQSIGALAIDPSDDNTVWAGTGEGNPRNDVTQGDGIYVTHDGAKTWKRVLDIPNSTVSAIVVDPKHGEHVVVGVLGDPFGDSDARGIYVTNDGGATWKKTLYLSPASGVSDLAMNPSRPNELLAAMWHFRRTAWTFASGGSDDGLYHSTDGGETWTKLQGHGLPEGTIGRIGVSFAASSPDRLYALIENKNGLLYRSDDDGATWKMMTNDRLIDERPFYYGRIFVDPTNPDVLIAPSVHLTRSADGGATFSIVARGVHGDHHTVWFSRDGTRVIEGNDGGLAFSYNHGKTWEHRLVLPISQPYHIGFSREPNYRVCVPLQDNGVWCAPSNPRAESLTAAQWKFIGGGDGTWAIFDPRDPEVIWNTSGGQNFSGDIHGINERSNREFDVSPYIRDVNVVDPKDLKYRFNWETPIVFDPFNHSRLFTAGNVVFETTDNGTHWNVISPDLTRNDKSHQYVAGTLTLDGTGAETSDTILQVVPSPAHRGEVWVGTDDGLVQLTRDGGATWKNVTPPGIAPWGRFASISVLPNDAATAYAIYDRHMVGDRRPYAFVTHDFGAHWRSIASGLRDGDEARTILADPNARGLLFLGTERAIYASWNDGASWSSIQGDLPTASVHDIEYQPDAHDLLIATHGRGAYVLDDVAALERLHGRGNVALADVRDAVMYNLHQYHRGSHNDGEAPEYGALFTYTLPSAAKSKPTAEILDFSGHVVRHLNDLPSDAGVNRFSWDFMGDTPDGWNFAPKWNRQTGAVPAVPGTYTLRLHVDGRQYTKPFHVVQDPGTHFTHAELVEMHNEVAMNVSDLASVDAVLNQLSTVEQESRLRASHVSNDAALVARLTQTASQAQALIASITSNPQNDQDDDFLQDILRERLQTQYFELTTNFAPVTAEMLREDRALHELTKARVSAAHAFLGKLGPLDAELKAQHLPALETLTVAPKPRGNGETGKRRSDDD